MIESSIRLRHQSVEHTEIKARWSDLTGGYVVDLGRSATVHLLPAAAEALVRSVSAAMTANGRPPSAAARLADRYRSMLVAVNRIACDLQATEPVGAGGYMPDQYAARERRHIGERLRIAIGVGWGNAPAPDCSLGQPQPAPEPSTLTAQRSEAVSWESVDAAAESVAALVQRLEWQGFSEEADQARVIATQLGHRLVAVEVDEGGSTVEDDPEDRARNRDIADRDGAL